MLSIKNLSKVYAGGKKAVDNMTIDIESGDFIALNLQREKLPLTVKISKSLIRLSFVAVSVMSYNKSA